MKDRSVPGNRACGFEWLRHLRLVTGSKLQNAVATCILQRSRCGAPNSAPC